MRLKTNIKEVRAFPNGIKLYSWDWKEEASTFAIDTRQKIGFIAQNVKKFYPDLVSKLGDTDYFGVNYAGVFKKCMG